jgi:PAS domain S-box-containing protein
VITGGTAGPDRIRSWAVAPLVGEASAWGTIAVFSWGQDRYGTQETELLGALADHASIALAGADLLGRLEESEDRYRSLIENLPDLVFTCGADGAFTFLSESVEALLGWPAQELVGRHFRDLVPPHPDGSPSGDRFHELVADPTHKMTTRFELRTAFGFNRPVEVSAAPIVRDGRFAGVHGSARDVGDRERLERELRESEARYRYLVESSPDLVWMTDAAGRLTYLSDRARPVVGWDPAELLGRSFADVARPADRRAAGTRFAWLRRHPTEPHRDRIRIVDRDGVERLLEVTAIGMVEDGVFVGAHGAARDIRELVRLEADLRRQAAELAAAEERAHLARELHDSVTQALFSMTLHSRSLELLLARDPAQVAGKLGELRELQRDALAEMRALIFELRPGNIAEVGVVEGLRTHAAGVSGRLGLPIVVESDLAERPAIETEEALYRIAQEALHNIVKHAGAREARVELVRLGPDIRLRVVDDGHGFDPAGVADGHLGLAGMRARAERVGGAFSVTSGPGRGTVVQATIPNVPPAWSGRTLAGAGVASRGTGRRA